MDTLHQTTRARMFVAGLGMRTPTLAEINLHHEHRDKESFNKSKSNATVCIMTRWGLILEKQGWCNVGESV